MRLMTLPLLPPLSTHKTALLLLIHLYPLLTPLNNPLYYPLHHPSENHPDPLSPPPGSKTMSLPFQTSPSPLSTLHSLVFLSTLASQSKPNTYTEALAHPQWLQAMNEELQALEENMTWVVTDIPSHKRPIGCKWLFKTKYLPNGNIERHKARLVILGNKQHHGIDYLETFAPIAKLTTVRSCLLLLLYKPGKYTKWMLKTPSSMGI